MDDEPSTYEIGSEEHTFVKTVAVEYALIQIARTLMRDRYGSDELKILCDQLLTNADRFNEALNEDGTPQSIAWKQQLGVEFRRIYSSIASDDGAWEDAK